MPIGIIQPYNLTVRTRREGTISVNPEIGGLSKISLESPLSLGAYGEYTISTDFRISINVKMWGGCGGSVGTKLGGGGGYTFGTISLTPGTQYTIIVGEAGKSIAFNIRYSSSGGGSTAILLPGNTPLLVAGAGGGASSSYTHIGGAGGGTSGQNAQGQLGGYGASQTAPGAGGLKGRRAGVAGSGPNGGAGSGLAEGGSVIAAGGRGYGIGGVGVFYLSDSGGGGGGGGYYGGGSGGGDGGGYPGGGGSGYFHPTLVTNGYTEMGSYSTPGNYGDADRLNSGENYNGVAQDGRVVISLAL